MKVIYEAFDGKQFEDKTECLWYEFESTHLLLNTITFFDENGNILSRSNEDDFYGSTYKLIVPSDEAAAKLIDYAKLMGWCCFEEIGYAGIWIWDDSDSFKREED